MPRTVDCMMGTRIISGGAAASRNAKYQIATRADVTANTATLTRKDAGPSKALCVYGAVP